MELTKQQEYQCMEDAARIWIDMMAVYYGTRMVEVSLDMDKPGEQPLGMSLPVQVFMQPFDFSALKEIQLSIKQDVGASSYWSEMANVQTLENLLMNNRIDTVDFLERLPNGYLVKRQELIDKLKAQNMMPPPMAADMGTGMSPETIAAEDIEVNPGSGNAALQRALNREGA
jgi:hypothetical protein